MNMKTELRVACTGFRQKLSERFEILYALQAIVSRTVWKMKLSEMANTFFLCIEVHTLIHCHFLAKKGDRKLSHQCP